MKCYIVAEAGINHNGDLSIAKQLMLAAKDAGADCVKFQKRTIPDCIPEGHRHNLVNTPWGTLFYVDYKKKLEFSREQYDAIDDYANTLNIDWTASVWDVASLKFLTRYPVPFIKIPSAKLTDTELLSACRDTSYPIVLSTGMSTLEEIDVAYECLKDKAIAGLLTLLHCVSTYPSEPKEVNLRFMQEMQERYMAVVGYSGHERGMQITLVAVALGAQMVERHLTLDRTMWGTDQSASLEPHAFKTLVRDIRIIEEALGDGEKSVQEREYPIRSKLRGK